MTDGMADQLPDEPTGTTIDGTPWDEARPPHLPDTVSGLPIPTILFTLGAIVVGILTIRDQPPVAEAGPGGLVQWVLSLSIPISSFLIPAAFFLRHRDAWSAHRTMALGTTLLAIGRALQILNGYLGEWYASVLPPSEELGISLLSIAMQVVVSLIAILAVVYIARGLDQARLYADRPGTRRWFALVALVAVVSSLMTLSIFGSLQTDVADATFTTSYWLAMLSVVLNVMTVSAWAFLTGQAIAGRRAGEDPNFGWFLAAFSGLCILALFFVSGLATAMVSLADVNPPGGVVTLISVLSPVAYLSLLAAFALRLPTTHAPLDEAEAEDDEVAGSDDPTEATATPDDLAGSTA
jgi:uncharacterized membrane protein YhaH (DUF805 family)